jgi:hypothetical protein
MKELEKLIIAVVSHSHPDRITPGTHWIGGWSDKNGVYATSCVRGVVLKANTSGLPALPVTASEWIKKKTSPHCWCFRTDPKENTTTLLPVGHCLGTEPTKECITSLLDRCLVTDPKEFTAKENAPAAQQQPTVVQKHIYIHELQILSILYIHI